jgi:inner membrane protein
MLSHDDVLFRSKGASNVGCHSCADGFAQYDGGDSRTLISRSSAVATIFSHGIAAVALGSAFNGERVPLRFWVAALVCAVLPDIDVVGFGFGVRYGDLLGHRGLTHSLLFALVVAVVTVALVFREATPLSKTWVRLVICFFVVTASHGLLDALTNGGLGVAFFAPFDNSRYFFPWQPIQVSPIGLDFFSSPRAMAVIVSEIVWIWIPSVLVLAAAWAYRRWDRGRLARTQRQAP